MTRRSRGHLAELENEAIWIIREVGAWFERPVILFSGGKDSIVLTWLARKAFHPAPIPFSLLHIDTGHNFPETIEFRDRFVRDLGLDLMVRFVQTSIDEGRVREEEGTNGSRNALQTVTLLDGLEELNADAALGGARRDEEKARAKERVFSHRNRFGQWDPRNQRPELWMLFNGRRQPGEHFRVFPLSNWTELDIWQYIQHQEIPVPALYLAHDREVVRRGGTLLARTEATGPWRPDDDVSVRRVRFRTVGDATCTGAFESDADTIEAIIRETGTARVTERGGRTDDRRSEAAMEDRKRAGYF
ncbi:MAG: sulfate adenylyltransferase subunit CysD [Gemmatimonadota bacterium]